MYGVYKIDSSARWGGLVCTGLRFLTAPTVLPPMKKVRHCDLGERESEGLMDSPRGKINVVNTESAANRRRQTLSLKLRLQDSN